MLAQLSPVLREGEFVFCTFVDGAYGDHADLAPLCAFAEAEGLTLVLPQDRADAAGCDYEGVFRCITLQVHSSLDAVGLTAAVSRVLAVSAIPANVVAAYYHDHVFVPVSRADEALAALQTLAG